MIKPINWCLCNGEEPLYKITLKKNGKMREGWVENFLVFKDADKKRLLKFLDDRCKQQHLKIKES